MIPEVWSTSGVCSGGHDVVGMGRSRGKMSSISLGLVLCVRSNDFARFATTDASTIYAPRAVECSIR